MTDQTASDAPTAPGAAAAHGLPPMSGFELSERESYSTATLECDLIMKGGITSGVIYPLAACRLATRYRVKQVGGASAGAIAAAFTAAAEVGRTEPAPAGFAGLSTLPNDMGTQLSTLFQPSRPTAAAFRLLTTWIEPGWGTLRRTAVSMWLLIRHAAVVAVIAFVLAMVPGIAVAAALQHGPAWPHWWTPRRSWLVWVIGSFVVALVAAAVRLGLKTSKAMAANGFGVCIGHSEEPVERGKRRADPPLTDWMTSKLDELAGLTGSGPLLFEHLQMAGVDLQVMTTCLTLRRPYKFPFVDDVFLVCRECMVDYFPTPVVEALAAGRAANLDTGAPARCPTHACELTHFPEVGKLPVVLAARISLSFPGLISAVPFHYIDFSRAMTPKPVITTWFSDGGIASNFPMHFFDTLWPRRPTFGINLGEIDADYPSQRVWRPTKLSGGILPRARAISSMTGFVTSILDTMQNWNDSTQLALPGFRDRVAEVRTTPDEGGLNLKMPPSTITALAELGSDAADLFENFDLELHKWTRYRVAMDLLDETLGSLHARYAAADPDGYMAFLATYAPLTEHYRFKDAPGSTSRLDADARATAELMNVADGWGAANHPATKGDTPHPRPVIRLVPPQ